jgi:hypothetical protein
MRAGFERGKLGRLANHLHLIWTLLSFALVSVPHKGISITKFLTRDGYIDDLLLMQMKLVRCAQE